MTLKMSGAGTSVERWPLAAAVAFVVLLGAGYGWVDLPPDIHTSGQAVAAWAQAHRNALALQALLVMLAWLPGGALVAFVHRRMSGAPAAAFLLGAALSVSLLAIGILMRLALARHSMDGPFGAARLLADVEAYWGPLATVPNVLQGAAVGVATREGVFPRWLLPITAIFALQQFVETLTIVGDTGLLAPGGTLNQLGAAFFGVWTISLGAAASGR
jgi:hypothetical protein